MATKKDILKNEVQHIDIKSFDARPIINAMKHMSFTARDTANATELLQKMIDEPEGIVILTLAGSTSAGGCMQIYVDSIYDTYIDEEQLQACDKTTKEIADSLPPKPHSSREFIREMGRYLTKHGKKKDSLVQAAFEHNVPIFCPAFSDSSAGFGLVLHQHHNPDKHLSIDSVKDFYELTKLKIASKNSGLFMIGGGVPKNFAQDTVVCAEILGVDAPMHKYAVQITVADARDGACSSSTLKEANSWGKVDSSQEQMVFAEATSVLPLMVSAVYHNGSWKQRKKRELAKILDK